MEGDSAVNVRKTKRQDDDSGRATACENGQKRRAALSTLTNQKLTVVQPETQKVLGWKTWALMSQIPVALLPGKRAKSDACAAPVPHAGERAFHWLTNFSEVGILQQGDCMAPKDLAAPAFFGFEMPAPVLAAAAPGLLKGVAVIEILAVTDTSARLGPCALLSAAPVLPGTSIDVVFYDSHHQPLLNLLCCRSFPNQALRARAWMATPSIFPCTAKTSLLILNILRCVFPRAY